MKNIPLRIIPTLLLISLVGCSSADIEPPIPTVSATNTEAPPTLTLLPSDTPEPTATLPVTIEAIRGIWTREDPARGTLFLTFREDGSFVAAHGTPGGVVHEGIFSLSNGVITFESGWDCSPLAGDVPGQYVLRQIADGKYLFFDLVEDSCPDRPSALKGFAWNRVVATQTPMPWA
jgi:hypothetical protein